MGIQEHHTHIFEPVCDRNSRILILGTFPSVKSRETRFYYGHPQNRFWKVLAGLMGKTVPATIEDKKLFLADSRIAVWDVIESCDITGSSDSSIKNVVPADIKGLLDRTDIRRIYANGGAAGKLYRKFVQDTCGREIEVLPSTSPANAAYSLERLIQEWSRITEVLSECGNED